ncbi:MAG: FprA family A-type flavoprotein, partial [Gammaproteobacteria bacterium]|nr:FprA family A-type flavoprotein [Gammaproteobacteria bacterium]
YVAHYREMSISNLSREVGGGEHSLVIFYMSSYGNTARMAEAISGGAETHSGVRVSIYDLEGGAVEPFVDLIEDADAVLFGSPTINGDAVKPVWDLLSSLAVVNLKGKLGGAFGSYGWTGEAVKMIEDRLRGLKMKIPKGGVRVKLIPTEEELEMCREFGRQFAAVLVGASPEGEAVDLADLG